MQLVHNAALLCTAAYIRTRGRRVLIAYRAPPCVRVRTPNASHRFQHYR